MICQSSYRKLWWIVFSLMLILRYDLQHTKFPNENLKMGPTSPTKVLGVTYATLMHAATDLMAFPTLEPLAQQVCEECSREK